MISHHPYQNPINKEICVQINYSLTHVFHLLVGYWVSFFYWHISHLLDFETADMVSFDTKYLLLIKIGYLFKIYT